jgi:hypothetical protein
MFVALDIADLARNGWLKQGCHNEIAESLSPSLEEYEERGYFIPFRARIDAESGCFTVYWPYRQDLQVRAVPVATSARRYWKFVCDGAELACGRLTRRLLCPDVSLLDPRAVAVGHWACRRCWSPAYPDHRRPCPSPEFRAQIKRHRAWLDLLDGNAAWTDATLRSLDEARAAEED